MFTQPSPNVHVRIFKKPVADLLLLSDIHWDNLHCDRALLTRHLNQARDKDARILLNGDTFCAMQGKYDPRSSKESIRPEHQVNNYLDALVDSAVEWFRPWADLIDFVGYGNHETSILKRQETDLCARFVRGLNAAVPSAAVQLGGYGGWYVARLDDGTARLPFKMKYMHGFGGGGPVTKGIIQHTRMNTAIHGADAVWMGHVHENYEQESAMEVLSTNYQVQLRPVLNLRTSTYKEEYRQGLGGWHVERGGTGKPLGGRWLRLERRYAAGRNYLTAASTKTT